MTNFEFSTNLQVLLLLMIFDYLEANFKKLFQNFFLLDRKS